MVGHSLVMRDSLNPWPARPELAIVVGRREASRVAVATAHLLPRVFDPAVLHRTIIMLWVLKVLQVRPVLGIKPDGLPACAAHMVRCWRSLSEMHANMRLSADLSR